MTTQTDHLIADDVLACEAAAMMHERQGFDWIPDPNASRGYALVRPPGCHLVVLAAPPEALEGVLDVLDVLPDYQGAACLVALYLVVETDTPDGPAYRVQPVGVCNPEGVQPMTFPATLVLEGAAAAEVDTGEVGALRPERMN